MQKNQNDLGRTKLVHHKIDTGTSRPIKQNPRRFPLAKREAADKEVDRMLEQGIIKESNSPWSSPVVLVTKKDGTLRFCVDYRKLNEVTKKDSFPLPRIDDCLDTVGGAKWFSTLDLVSGYWQVEMCPNDMEKTAFVTTRGLFEFQVLSFGLCNAVSCFSCLMEMVLRGLCWKTCLAYIDDVIIFAPDFDTHMKRLQEVFDRLEAAGLKLAPRKCHLLRKEVAFLGHRVSAAGVRSDPSKVEAVQAWPTPTNVTQVRSFLGLCSDYRKFIRSFADIAGPLHALTSKSREFRWTQECELAMDQLKTALTSSPLLSSPREEGEFILDTDASFGAVGAVLSQMQEEEEKVILYYSKALSRSERNYCVTRKELLAIVLAVKHCQHYLIGAKFRVRTDHGALRWLTNFKNPDGQTARWIQILSAFDLEIEHRKGRKHSNADALSRRPCEPSCSNCTRQEQKEDAAAPVGLAAATATQSDRDLEAWIQKWKTGDWTERQADDACLQPAIQWVTDGVRPKWEAVKGENPTVRRYWEWFDQLELRDGVLCRKRFATSTETSLQIVVPATVKRELFQFLHHHRTGGHQGIHRTLERLQRHYCWPGQRGDIERWCRVCEVCQFRKIRGGRGRAPLCQDAVGAPFERTAIDILTFPVPTENGNTCVLVVSDYFSKWTQDFALPDHRAVTVADVLVTEVFLQFGTPTFLHSDQGPEFQSELFRQLNQLLEIKQTRTTPYRPQSDGMVERFNRTLLDMLSKLCAERGSDWDDHLAYALCAYLCTPHASTGCSPNLLMFGREISMPVDLVYGVDCISSNPTCPVEYVE